MYVAIVLKTRLFLNYQIQDKLDYEHLFGRSHTECNFF